MTDPFELQAAFEGMAAGIRDSVLYILCTIGLGCVVIAICTYFESRRHDGDRPAA